MAQLKETWIYSFDELSESAKEKAREWFREGQLDYDWWDSVYEDAERMGNLLGIEFDRKSRNLPCIWFSGFCSQGDGACWEGAYRYASGALKTLQREAPAGWKDGDGVWHDNPSNVELHRIARKLQEVQRRHFYQLEAISRHRGHYYHSGCMDIDVTHAESRYRDIGDAEDDIKECLRDFADWIYARLEEEYDWLTGDEQVDESIRCNEYTFDESGEPDFA